MNTRLEKASAELIREMARGIQILLVDHNFRDVVMVEERKKCFDRLLEREKALEALLEEPEGGMTI